MTRSVWWDRCFPTHFERCKNHIDVTIVKQGRDRGLYAGQCSACGWGGYASIDWPEQQAVYTTRTYGPRPRSSTVSRSMASRGAAASGELSDL